MRASIVDGMVMVSVGGFVISYTADEATAIGDLGHQLTMEADPNYPPMTQEKIDAEVGAYEHKREKEV